METNPAEVLAGEVVEHRARTHPGWATLVGLRGHDHALRASSAEAYAREAAEVEDFLRRAEAMPASLERDALVAFLSLEAFELREARTWARNPDLASEFFDHLFGLLVAAHLAPDARADALAARLQGAARFFGDAWPRFAPADVPPLWVEGARQSVDAADAFFDAVRDAARGTRSEARVAAAVEEARRVVADHARWLDRLAAEARGDFALGEPRFARLLRLRLVDDSVEELLALGERTVARFRRSMEDAARDVLAEAGRAGGVDEALALMKADHPRDFAGVLAAYRDSIKEARAFVASRGLCRMTDVPLDVVETPAFLRHLVPFAAYMGPARFASPRRGVYLVTRKDDLSAFPLADVRNTTVHEAWPGHHLQVSVATESAGLAAFLCEMPDLSEGWALYCEEWVAREGYADRPMERLVRARDARWRAVRIVLDASLHARGMRAEDAAARLAAETGMTPEEAAAEVLRYTLSPAYNLSYMWGRLRIEALRDRLLARGWSERGFHDALLGLGSVPVALVERSLEARPPA